MNYLGNNIDYTDYGVLPNDEVDDTPTEYDLYEMMRKYYAEHEKSVEYMRNYKYGYSDTQGF